MNLDESQKQKVRSWVEQGLQAADIQKRLADELGVRLTYMEVRFLLADLDLKPKDKEQPASLLVGTPQNNPPVAGKKGPSPTPAPSPEESAALPGGVSLTVDQITRAGAVVSGKVTFSDGKSAEWYLDQMGRLGMAPKEKGYRPSQEDLMDFQTALQNELARMGF